MSETLSDVLNALKAIYVTQDNDLRRHYTAQLEQLEHNLTRNDLVSIGLSLLSNTQDAAPVQAYGAVMLRKAVQKQNLRVEKLPFWDLLRWYCTDASLNRLLCADLEELLLICSFRLSTEHFSRLLNLILSSSDLSKEPRRVSLLKDIVVKCLDPDLKYVPSDRVGILRKTLCEVGSTMLQRMNQTLFSIYSSAGGAGSGSLPLNGVQDLLEACIAVIGALAPHLDFTAWSESSLSDTMTALLHWWPAQRAAINAASALLRSHNLSTDQNSKIQMLYTLFVDILRALNVSLSANKTNAVEDVLDILSELPRPFIQKAGIDVCHFLIHILTIPSLLFATQVCLNLTAMDISILVQINPIDVFASVRFLAVKNQFHPEKGTHAEGIAFVQDQFGSIEAYERGFSDFRNQCGKLLEILARLSPELANKFTLQLLNELCDPAGTGQDERTSSGFVTQRSQTYVSWEVTEFMISHLRAGFSSSHNLYPCITALLQHRPSDAVLLPVYLNILSHFWVHQAPDMLNIWEGILNILFACIEKQNVNRNDPDIIAARRRAHTLLVTASTEHSLHIPPTLISKVIQRIRSHIIASFSIERLLLHEAVAGFASYLPEQEAEACMASFIDPIVTLLRESVMSLDQGGFIQVILGEKRDTREMRNRIGDALGILAAVFRRCRLSTYTLAVVTELTPILNHLTMVIHGITPEMLPSTFASVLDMPEDLREQYLPGHSRRSVVGENFSAVQKANFGLSNIRFSLYQLYGSLCRFISSETLENMLALLRSSLTLPIYHLRILSEKCLFLIGQHNAELLPQVLSILRDFFKHRMTRLSQQMNTPHRGSVNSSAQQLQNDIVERKQWFHYSKDVLSYVRARVIETGAWKDIPPLLGNGVELVAAVLDSGSDSIDSCRLITCIVDMKYDHEDPVRMSTLRDAQLIAYGRLIRYLVFTESTFLSQRDRETIAYMAAEPYASHHATLHRSLELAGISPKQIEELNLTMMMSNGPYVMRRKIKEKFLSWTTT